MISSEAQRTLVKSPPELWAELSDPATLAQHLNELGEVRVTGTEPERTVEWEASSATGRIELSPSGWGTKVKLSLQRQPPATQEPEQEASAPTQDPADLQPAEPEGSATAEPEDSAAPPPEDAAAPPPEISAASEPQLDEPATSRALRFRFFARLFRRRRSEPVPAEAVEPEPLASPAPLATPAATVSSLPLAAPEPAPIDAQPQGDASSKPPAPTSTPIFEQREDGPSELATELHCVEEALAAADTQMLNGILDRLGAAHHRPFSRA